MYAIIDISGQQFKVKKDQQIFVNRLEAKEGSKVDFDTVLLLDDGKKINIGDPKINGVIVTAKVIEHLKGDKVIVFKKKRRKGYRVKNGHRDYLTKLEILNIHKKTAVKKTAVKKTAVKKTAVKKTAVKKTAVKKTAVKKTAVKKTAVKKTAVKKTAVKKGE